VSQFEKLLMTSILIQRVTNFYKNWISPRHREKWKHFLLRAFVPLWQLLLKQSSEKN